MTEDEIYKKRKENEEILIKGNFVMCGNSHKEEKENDLWKDKNICAVKISEIKLIERIACFETEEVDVSYIYTSKNNKYITHLHYQQLIDLVNKALI